MKCEKIEIYNSKEEKWDTIETNAVFNLAVVSGYDHPNLKDIGYYGINIGISIPLSDKDDYELFCERYWDNSRGKNGEIIVYLIGNNNEKVPIEIREGHGYDLAYESLCLFGYITPEIIASDNYPEYKNKDKATFGSYHMELRGSLKHE
jgi:hypothetical protein